MSYRPIDHGLGAGLPAPDMPVMVAPAEGPGPLQEFLSAIGWPLLQNVIGGVAVGIMIWVVLDAKRWDPQAVMFWAERGAMFFAAMFSVIRFFGDDLGLMRASYRAGVASKAAKVKALEMGNEALSRQVATLGGKVEIASGVSVSERDTRAVIENAAELVRRAYDGQATDRRTVVAESMMGQKDWNRAIRLIRKAGVMDDKEWLFKDYARAIKAVREEGDHGLEIAAGGGKPEWSLSA